MDRLRAWLRSPMTATDLLIMVCFFAAAVCTGLILGLKGEIE